MVLTIWDLLKALYKHKFAIIAVTLAAFLCTYIYVDRNQSYTAKTVIQYKDSCIKEGKTLDGETFDVYEMISPNVISDVIEDLSISHSVESIRSQITIEPIIPDSQTALREANEKEGEEYTYYPDSFVISFKATKSFTYAEARDILDSLIQNYLTYYTEKYLNLATLQEIDYGMENADFDYIEKAEILRSNINSTINTLASYSKTDSKFRSTSTGYTFNDISKEFNHLSDFNIPLIFSEIYRGQVTNDKALLLDKYTEKKEQYELTSKNMSDKANMAEDRMNTFADANVSVPNSYNESDSSTNSDDIHIIDGVYGNNETIKYNEQTTYDELIGNYVNYSVNANDNTIDAQYCQNIIEIFSAEPDPSIDRDEYTKSVDANIKETSERLKELYKSTYNAIDDYNQYTAAKHMSFLTGVQYYENISTVVYSFLALVLGLGFSVIAAIAIEIFRKYRRYTLKRVTGEDIPDDFEEDGKKKKFRFWSMSEDEIQEYEKTHGGVSPGNDSPNDVDDVVESVTDDTDVPSDVDDVVESVTDDTDVPSDVDDVVESATDDTDVPSDVDDVVESVTDDTDVSSDVDDVVESATDDTDVPSDTDAEKHVSESIGASDNRIKASNIPSSYGIAKPRKKGSFRALKVIGIAVLVIVLLIAAAAGLCKIDNSRIKTTEYTYTSDKVTDAFDGYKIALITDYHDSELKDKVVEAVKSSKPDIICIGGDLVNMNTEDFTDIHDFVEQLTEIAPVYYAYGNHEIWSNNENDTETPVIEEKLKDLDVIFINDETVKIKKDGDWFYLTGFEDLKYDDLQSGDVYRSVLEENMKKLSKNITEDKLSVLLFHRANYFDTVSKYPYDLVLSGHIHAGQIGISPLAQMVVEKHLGSSEYIVGEYTENDNEMIVCGGIGFTFDLPRILCPPEIVTITLSSDKDSAAATATATATAAAPATSATAPAASATAAAEAAESDEEGEEKAEKSEEESAAEETAKTEENEKNEEASADAEE